MDNRQALYNTGRGCNKCTLCRSRHNVVNGDGDLNAEIVLVSTSPGFEEDEIGKPMVGPSGRLLNSMLEKAGIDRKKVWVTNVVRCLPREGRTIREPNPEEIEACSEFIDAELAALPMKKIIIPLGNVALKYITNTKTGAITSKRGHEEKSEKYSCWVLPTFHPRAVA